MGLPIIPTENAMQTTLDTQLVQGGTSATLADDWSTQLSGCSSSRPSWMVIDRVDSNGVSTPTKREYVKITGVSGQTVTLGARGEAGSSDQAHSVGAVVELVLDVSTITELVNTFGVEHSATTGAHTSALVTTLKASSAEVTTGTEDAKIVTPKALKDAGIVAVTPYTYSDWQTISATLTYSSADSPTFVATTSVDLTSIIPVGARIKLTQTTAKYFIVTAIASNSITLYGGTDYTLANASITSPYYSTQKAPIGFPLDPTKWTVLYSTTGAGSQSTPTQNIWYNPTSHTISVPIGSWIAGYDANPRVIKSSAATYVNVFTTLSTANNSESDTDFTAGLKGHGGTNSFVVGRVHVQKVLTVASKTAYYLNMRTTEASMSDIQMNDGGTTTKIFAISAYL